MNAPQVPAWAASTYDFASWTDATNLIGGTWQLPLESHGSLGVINPRHGKAIAQVHMAGAADVDAAVKAAKAAQPAWADLPIRERAAVFYKLRELMERDVERLSWLVSHENGKTYAEAKAEVLKSIECVEFGCSLPNLAAGSELQVSRGVTCRLEYAPVGVVAGVSPFNFPLMVPLWMLPQAIVGGNAFILKPSEQTPLSMIALGELFREAGLPDGIFNVVQGGREAVEALCDHPGIGAFGFVGSTRVAKLVYGRSAMAGKRSLCLGGAKNHLIVVPDADLEVAAGNIVASFTGCAGQRCMAAANLLAVGDVEHILDEIKKRAAALTLGEDLGAINSAESITRIRGYIDGAVSDGATLAVDGRGSKVNDSGYWLGPTIIDGVTKEQVAAREEIFGPVLSIIRVKDLSEALAIENGNPYGNASAVYTTSGEVARKVMGNAEAGMCGVNVGVPVPREPFGFGGWNDSKFGAGNITGWDGFRFWTRVRKVTTKWALQADQNWMN
ncbi:MAG: methylmalonate-semialdehyde dehydrogenase (CoA acylating) [Deltaproteobacteria bacterium]|nr:methylmalonate-semialdehyde dehydrogenase (CoA acylating) [Deltaproteobacteria bacterium]HCH63324.1 methylmalonate-semialdehyde dehydrogenase (CoA acylating) [Deltaproteobacteria bacterium]